MNARIKQLRQRRELLVLRAAVQRNEASSVAAQLHERLWLADIAFSIVQAIRIQPTLAAASATLLLPKPRNKLLLWGGRLFTAWEFFVLARKQLNTVKTKPLH